MTTLTHSTDCVRCHTSIEAGVEASVVTTQRVFGELVTSYRHTDTALCYQRRVEHEGRIAERRAAREQAEQQETTQVATLATERQVAYARDLMRENPGVAAGTTVAHLRQMKRGEISQLINILRESD